MRHLTLTEGAPPIALSLSDAEAAALDAAELAVVSRHPRDDRWEVAAGTKVGVATVGELQVTIRPKVPIDRLVFMIGYAREPSFWRANTVELAAEKDLPAALAESFGRQVVRALDQGLLQGYREHRGHAAGPAWPAPRRRPDRSPLRARPPARGHLRRVHR